MWRTGDEVEVRAQVRGQADEDVLGTVVIEDLDGIVRHLPPGDGANGPRSPMTQFLLQAAVSEMGKRLAQGPALRVDEDAAPNHDAAVARVMSSLVGHEPFVTNTLGLSVHQMRRRWPVAGDWYADLVRYVLRGTRSDIGDRIRSDEEEWLSLDLGEFMSLAVTLRWSSYRHPELLGLAQTIRSLWPAYEPVIDATHDGEAGMARWGPFITYLLSRFGLRLRPGVSIGEILWSFDALASTEEQRARSRSESILFAEVSEAAPGGRDYPYPARAVMLILAGALVDEDGQPVPLDELYRRRAGSRPAQSS